MGFGKRFLKAEEEFLQSKRKQAVPLESAPAPDAPKIQRGLRGRGRSREAILLEKAREMVSKSGTVEFFRSILDDETEKKLWLMFMTGKVMEIAEDGTGILKEVELNPISLKAFLRAVEYKRGQPVQPIEAKGREISVVEVITLGAGDDYFREQAKLSGLLGS